MEILITDKIRLTSDGERNFIIQERKLIKSNKEGIEDRYEWKTVGYHGRLTQACTALINAQALRSETTALNDLQNELKNLTEKIIAAIQEYGDSIDKPMVMVEKEAEDDPILESVST